ncbi:MAG: hypothetical protein JW864_16955 [Spirochaetes bacterium]|nr:hypothetical protein [Spirochaetota bacterium]
MDNNNSSRHQKHSIIFRLYCASAYIIIPVFLLTGILLFQLTSSEFFTHILKNSDFIETYINAEKWDIEEKIKAEIEDKVHLEKFRSIFESAKAEYEKKSEEFRKLNKTEEYEKLKKEKDEISGLPYQRAPSSVKSPEDFKAYKETELARINSRLDEIEKYREDNEEEIEKLEDAVEDLEDVFEDAGDELDDRKEDANDIVLSHENSLKGQILSDLKKITPVLTEELNKRLINTQVKEEAGKMISFFTSYAEQKEVGNVSADRLDSFVRGNANDVKVRIPEITLNLWVEDEINGVKQKRHLLSEVFVDRIREIDGLKNRNMFIKLFKFSESGLAEKLGRSYLNEMGMSIKNGVIKIKSKQLEGRDAVIIQTAMLSFTAGNYLKYILPAIALIMFFTLFLNRKGTYRRIKNILIYPSVLIIILYLALIGFSNIFVYFPGGIKSPVAKIYIGSVSNTAAVYFAAPGIALFLLLFVIGLFFRRKARAEKEQLTEKKEQIEIKEQKEQLSFSDSE